MPEILKKILPLIQWVFSGGLAVVVDLLCLYVFVEFFGIHYILAAAVAFFISASTNYTISRFIIFKNAQHSTTRSYSTFMSISLFGLAAIALGMFVLVDIFHLHYLVSRIFLAGTLGVSSFFLHKYISFKDTTKLQ